MTCIVGLEHESGVTIGGDAAAVDEHHVTVRSDAKVFKRGEYLVGFADSYRAGQLLAYRLNVPPQVGEDDFEHMATAFVDAVKRCLAEDDEAEAGLFLVGYRGALYYVDADLHVGRAACGYEAIGLGAPFALGSMASSFGSPFARVHGALAASQRHCTAVRQPFTILDLPKEQP